jgi:hypothetical protein
MKSIDVVMRELCLAIADGRSARQMSGETAPAGGNEGGDASGAPGRGDRRGSRRPQTRAGELAGQDAPAQGAAAQ